MSEPEDNIIAELVVGWGINGAIELNVIDCRTSSRSRSASESIQQMA